jgi:hypothetical protein
VSNSFAKDVDDDVDDGAVVESLVDDYVVLADSLRELSKGLFGVVSETKTAFDWTHGSPTFPKRAEVKLKCGVAVSLQQPVLEDAAKDGIKLEELSEVTFMNTRSSVASVPWG